MSMTHTMFVVKEKKGQHTRIIYDLDQTHQTTLIRQIKSHNLSFLFSIFLNTIFLFVLFFDSI